jgi:osmoprotectant transport system ATP-binding protein
MIIFEHVHKTYEGGFEAVYDLSMEVAEGETMVLLGTSGSGKTTSLKMVNRLIEPTKGRILIQKSDIMQRDPVELRRKIGYAIQNIGLFPHMTVGENISVVPRLLRWSDRSINQQISKMLTMVGLPPEEFKDRYPAQLSGGQKQRVGVARALSSNPPIILMDEPFGALDPITREQLQNEFLDLQAGINKTILFVTHDIFEAVKMGDRIALMDRGRLQQLSTPAELVENPANEFVDAFLGQHRFQLSLLTKTLKSIMEKNTEDTKMKKVETYLSARGSLVDALDTFKKTKTDALPVFYGEKYLGMLKKEKLLGVIAGVLGKT